MVPEVNRVRGRLDAGLIVATLLAAMTCLSCRGQDKPRRAPAAVSAVVVRDTTHQRRDTADSPGEILDDSVARPSGRWITDANVFALLGVMNAKTIAAADVELTGWHSEPVRAFAAMMAREHAELQHSADSLSERDRIAPVMPALAQSMSATMGAQLDSMTQFRTTSLDRAFLREQIASHEFMLEYAQRLTAVAERPDVRLLASSAAARLSMHLERARALQSADLSAGPDSLTRRRARPRP